MKYLIEFVLVLVLISLLYIRPDALYSFYNNILGRLVLIVAVVLLTHQSTLAGLLGVLFVVAISQSVYEGMATKDEVTEDDEQEDREEDIEETFEEETEEVDEKAEEAEVGEVPDGDNESDEGFEGFEVFYGEKPHLDKMAEFKKKHCENGKLTKGGEKAIALDFPNIKYNGGVKCNVCDDGCSYEVEDADVEGFSGGLLTTDEALRPKSSNQTTPLMASEEVRREVEKQAKAARVGENFE